MFSTDHELEVREKAPLEVQDDDISGIEMTVATLLGQLMSLPSCASYSFSRCSFC
jgi:hypothetical protein